jgi:hypothetical protein
MIAVGGNARLPVVGNGTVVVKAPAESVRTCSCPYCRSVISTRPVEGAKPEPDTGNRWLSDLPIQQAKGVRSVCARADATPAVSTKAAIRLTRD